MSDQAGDAMIYALLLLLPLSALAVRRLPLGTVARYALAWLAIFLLALVAVIAWQRFSGDHVGDVTTKLTYRS